MLDPADEKVNEKGKKGPAHYLAGMGVSGMFWWWGAVFLFAPIYLNISGKFAHLLTALGIASIIISFVGALLEIAKLWESQAFNYFAAAALFLVPALILHFFLHSSTFSGIIELIGKLIVISLLMIGGPLFFAGLPYMFPDIEKEYSEIGGGSGFKKPKQRVNLQTKISFITAFLALLTAIFRIVVDFQL